MNNIFFHSIIFLKIRNLLVKENNEITISVTGDELETIIDTMEEEGSIDEDEAEMLQSVLDLNDKTVYEIMTPRVDVVGIELGDSIEEIKELFFLQKFSRIPVYVKSIDNVIGVLHERDFLTMLIKGETFTVQELMADAFFVSKSMRVDTLIETLQRENTHLAIVSDEFGGTGGIVTMEDALEELVGEIYDEHDDVDGDLIHPIKENKFGINAEISLEDLFDDFQIKLLDDSNRKWFPFRHIDNRVCKQNTGLSYSCSPRCTRYTHTQSLNRKQPKDIYFI